MKAIIHDVKLIDRAEIKDERGAVRHGLRIDEDWYREEVRQLNIPTIDDPDPRNEGIREVYFSTVNPGVIKGWHLHLQMRLRYLCVRGRVTVGLYDLREASPTYKVPMKIEMAAEGPHYKMLIIPPGIWNAFRVIDVGGTYQPATICNIATRIHDPSELVRAEIGSLEWPLDWGAYEKSG